MTVAVANAGITSSSLDHQVSGTMTRECPSGIQFPYKPSIVIRILLIQGQPARVTGYIGFTVQDKRDADIEKENIVVVVNFLVVLVLHLISKFP